MYAFDPKPDTSSARYSEKKTPPRLIANQIKELNTLLYENLIYREISDNQNLPASPVS